MCRKVRRRGKSFGVGVLCEELLAAGIPVVAIDPEGELYTLRERFRVLVLVGAHADLPLPSGWAGEPGGAPRGRRPSCASSRKRRSGGSSPASRARTALHRRSSACASAARR
ncbi:helicase HerA domain-containing protein [Sorangium sp. So ce117]|uniref:helicase HerA domain-containing protein n=1 Tax=Sorangium sp. So ce117 TaxID=3133277 RepID=UPI003F5DDAC1